MATNIKHRIYHTEHSVWANCRQAIVRLSILFMSFVLFGCMDNSGTTSPNNKASGGNALVVSTDTVYMTKISGQYSVRATLVDGNGVAYLQQPTLTWQSNTPNIVSVDSNGMLTALAMGTGSIEVTADNLQKTISVVVNSNVITLNGQVRYEDKEYNASGFIAQTNYFKAVRYAKVDLLSSDNSVLQTTYTDDQGKFSFSGVIGSQQLISVSAATDISRGLGLQVKDRSDQLYAVTTSVSLNNNLQMAIDIPLSSPASGAFNILDVITNAAQFSIANTSLNSMSLSVFWQENNSDGTYFCSGYDSYYCTQGKGIYVYNQPGGDTDEYDDDVLYHEFGHFFMDTISRDDSPGGCHTLSARDLDLRLAWSEGFGDFFPSAVKYWLANTIQRPDLLSVPSGFTTASYVDTAGNYAQISVDLGNLNTSLYSSAANEMAVAKILYGLYLNYGFQKMAAVFDQYLPNVATPVNLESFWDGWINLYNPDQTGLNALYAIFGARNVHYQDDGFENDDNLLSLARNPIAKSFTETHYLYKPVGQGPDVDIIPFAVTQGKNYVVSTLNLSGGTDTYLKILDSNGNTLLVNNVEINNDDADPSAYTGYDSVCGASRVKNNGTALSSLVNFTSPGTGTYYAEVRTTTDPNPYQSAGRYGNYDIEVQEN